MANPKVSIIVPVYNVEKYFDRCLSSLKSQTLEDIEIILVDDGSKDSSGQLCDREAMNDSRIKVIHKENGGAGHARNAGLEICSGDYVGFVDSDDFVQEDMFRSLYETAEKYGSDLVMSGVRVVGGSIFSKAGDCDSKAFFDKDTHFETGDELNKLRMGIVGALPGDPEDSKYGMSVWKNICKTSVIKENNILFRSEREFLSEDSLFMIEFIAKIRKATGVKEAFYNYCRNDDSISKSYKKDNFARSLVFAGEVEKNFEDIGKEEYGLYLDRFWQAICRVFCSQAVMNARDKGLSYGELRQELCEICTNPRTVRALKTYPIHTLPLMQRVFAYAMKHRAYPLMKLLVELRSK